MSLLAGTRLGPYEILSPLGAGGMGEVYQARDGKLNRDAAVKVLPPHLSESPRSVSVSSGPLGMRFVRYVLRPDKSALADTSTDT